MAVAPEERKLLLSQVNRLAQNQLNNLWAQADRLSSSEFAAFLVAGFPELVDPFVEMSAMLAANWFEESLPASQYVAVTAPPIPVDRLTSSASWALGGNGDVALDRLTGTLQRAVYDGARDTTMLNVKRTDSKWARYASANACEFCRLMSIRGAVYHTENIAGSKFHDNDRCIAVEDRTGDYQPPDYISRWEDEYVQARDAAGSGDTKQILSAWRQLAV